jgi:hypothetical protein
MPNAGSSNNQFVVPYLRTVTIAGCAALLFSLYQIHPAQLDLRFSALLAIAVLLSPRIVIPIPKLSSQISVSDTFVFLVLLLYGGPAAVLVASTEAFFSSLRFSRRTDTVLFNWGSVALSVFITSSALKYAFGDIVVLASRAFSTTFLVAIGSMALIHYISNSGIVAIGTALKTNQSIWQTWRKHFLWTSITYFVGASAAAGIAALINLIGFSALAITLPIICIVYLTYRTYLKNVETSAAQADQAEKHV